MAQVRCFNCDTTWELGAATTNRCPTCGWITEIYYDQAEAKKIASLYNRQPPPLSKPAGVCPLEGLDGFSVSFPDQDRLASIAELLLDVASE